MPSQLLFCCRAVSEQGGYEDEAKGLSKQGNPIAEATNPFSATIKVVMKALCHVADNRMKNPTTHLPEDVESSYGVMITHVLNACHDMMSPGYSDVFLELPEMFEDKVPPAMEGALLDWFIENCMKDGQVVDD